MNAGAGRKGFVACVTWSEDAMWGACAMAYVLTENPMYLDGCGGRLRRLLETLRFARRGKIGLPVKVPVACQTPVAAPEELETVDVPGHEEPESAETTACVVGVEADADADADAEPIKIPGSANSSRNGIPGPRESMKGQLGPRPSSDAKPEPVKPACKRTWKQIKGTWTCRNCGPLPVSRFYKKEGLCKACRNKENLRQFRGDA